MIPILFGVTVIIFIVSHSLPTDPVLAVIGEQASEHPAIVQAYRERWGLDRPLPFQYVTYVTNLLHGDFGISINSHRPVAQDIKEYLPATVELATLAVLLSALVSVPLGILAATRRGSVVDALIRAFTLLGVSMPIFWLALVALDVFYLRLGIAPGLGRLDATDTPPPAVTGLYTVDSLWAGQFDTFFDALRHLALPSLVLASWSIGLLTRITRTSMLAILHQDFLRTARSKGASERYVIWRHAFGNAVIPVVTVVGLAYGDLLSGAVMTETIFSWPGIGRYAYQAATLSDFPAIMGVALVVAFTYLVVNLIIDVVYGVIDPRVRAAMS
ncbi:ABC transporter permease [bacterium]|nr:MAG: ABC transporter permease [bacterium]